MSAAQSYELPTEQASNAPALELATGHDEVIEHIGPTAFQLLGLVNPNGTMDRPAGFDFLLRQAQEQ